TRTSIVYFMLCDSNSFIIAYNKDIEPCGDVMLSVISSLPSVAVYEYMTNVLNTDNGFVERVRELERLADDLRIIRITPSHKLYLGHFDNEIELGETHSRIYIVTLHGYFGSKVEADKFSVVTHKLVVSLLRRIIRDMFQNAFIKTTANVFNIGGMYIGDVTSYVYIPSDELVELVNSIVY
ncbi:MAG: hypothetical protein QXS16_04060, partial [Pyrobaculum sp.]